MPRIARILSAVAGAVLFVYALRTAGVENVLDGMRRTGVGFIWIILLSGFRYIVRCEAWRLCVEEPERLSLRDALAAFVTGDAIGNLTFFGPVASESTKAVIVRQHLPTMSALASIALENIFYALSVAAMVLLGTLVFADAFAMNTIAQIAVAAIGSSAIALAVVTLLLLYRSPRVLTRVAEALVDRLPIFSLSSRVDAIRELEDRIHRFARSHPARVPQVLFYEFLFHAAGVAEIFVILRLLVGGLPVTLLLESMVLETVNRIITIAFKFVPMRIGVDEAGSGLAAQVLTLTSGVGVTLAIVRKARTLLWAGVGLLTLALSHSGLGTRD